MSLWSTVRSHPLHRLLGSAMMSLLDQAIVSVGHFLTLLFLARRLSEDAFGVYSILWQILIVLGNLHYSLTSYPLTVRGAGGDARSHVPRLLLPAIGATLIFGIAGAIALLIGAGAMNRIGLAPILIGAMLAWQLQDLFRRALMAQQRYAAPILGDILRYLGQAGLVFFLIKPESGFNLIFLLIIVPSFLGGAVQLLQNGLIFPPLESTGRFISSGWVGGRWMLLNNLLNMVNIQVVIWCLAAFHGTADAGQFTAVTSILAITHPLLLGLTGLMIPSIAFAAASGERRFGIRIGMFYSGMGAMILLPVWVMIALFPQPILGIFFPGKYDSAATALRLMVLFYVIDYGGRMLETTLNGLQHNPQSSRANLAAAVVTVGLTLPLTWRMGIHGAIIGGCVAVAARAIVGGYYLVRGDQLIPSQRSASS